eukprot:7684837-Prorocentrum_lima.AAC.1
MGDVLGRYTKQAVGWVGRLWDACSMGRARGRGDGWQQGTSSSVAPWRSGCAGVDKARTGGRVYA